MIARLTGRKGQGGETSVTTLIVLIVIVVCVVAGVFVVKHRRKAAQRQALMDDKATLDKEKAHLMRKRLLWPPTTAYSRGKPLRPTVMRSQGSA